MTALPAAIVDSHHHLWDLSRIDYPWLGEQYDASAFILGEYYALCRDFLPRDFREAWGGMPVVASVHIEAECARSQALAETRWLHEQAAASGLPSVVVAHVDLLAEDAGERLAEQAAHPLVRSIRFKPVTARRPQDSVADRPGALQDARWPAALDRLRQHGLAWDLRVPFWHLEEAAAVLRDFPGLPVVLQHTGLPWDRSAAGLAAWRRGMEALAALPGVHVRLSELGLRDRPWRLEENLPVVRDAVAIFGWQRAMFGSNFPVAGLRISYPALVRAMAEALAHLDEKARQAIWCDNAAAFYRIKLPGAGTPAEAGSASANAAIVNMDARSRQ
jgi:predicted TIM-barrel fold metal-dependent hydrolase